MERVISKMLHQQQAKNAFYMLGILWSCKTCVKLAIDFYQGFKTFVLPSFWRPSSQSQWVEEYGSWAVITGCSRGIGLCYAQELARRGLNLILIGRQLSKLQQIAQDFQSEYKIMVDIIEADFTKSTKQLSKVIKNGLEGKDIGILVNNVGVILPFPTYFNEMYEDQWQQMIQVNIGAATLMTHIVLPKLEAKKKGAIINLASVSGCSPQPLQSVYAATKAYMDFFSRGLQVEYADKGTFFEDFFAFFFRICHFSRHYYSNHLSIICLHLHDILQFHLGSS